MAVIHLLEQATIDKIAAGEVVERPRSIVKELTENAIDAGATATTVEIRDGGIAMIRVTDDGAGIPADQVRTAFLRHATSKIEKVDDLTSIRSFGFRGEALSSIAAVSRVELITKPQESLVGTRYRIEGGIETGMEEIGAPNGSTFVCRDLFYNTPARRKFLKSAQTEAGYIAEFVERLALSHPELAIKFMANGATKLATSGNGKQADVIYRIFGREISGNLIEVDQTDEATGMHLHGFLGKPQISRGNRTYEIYYVNGRLIASNILSKAAEEGYETFLMQHRFPFLILALDLDGTLVDVNVHPAKAQVRFADGPAVYNFVKTVVKGALTHRELIIRTGFGKEDHAKEAKKLAREVLKKEATPEPFEFQRRQQLANETNPGWKAQEEEKGYDFRKLREEHPAAADSPYSPMYPGISGQREESVRRSRLADGKNFLDQAAAFLDAHHNFQGTEDGCQGEKAEKKAPVVPAGEDILTGRQMTLEELGQEDDNAVFLSKEHVKEHRLIGQVFDTYWIVEFRNSLYIIDQHAAHEKVMFERLMKRFRDKEVSSQRLSPPMIVSLTMAEEDQLRAHRDTFAQLGFEIQPFGDRDYAISAVPQDLFGLTEKEFFLEMLDQLSPDTGKTSMEEVTARIATMACKAAVKGNTRLSTLEADALITELLSLDDPYNCPHGRPTIISMTKSELEKKFRRIV
ncbi:MAG TPA: DNA mismatch repair endonuclease MutL [Lachnospiraceae bacterium]|nr:DNA mismatch repair endonuclease MutL [Lachnospiraceae bacterium]